MQPQQEAQIVMNPALNESNPEMKPEEMLLQTTVATDAMSEHEEIDLKNFAKYLQHISFDEALHRVRRISWDSVLASEFLIGEEPQTKTPPMKKVANL